uniref:Uncharacterized protein n=1 Tax=Rhizophora mucronata TaxID=61149 RepID=A0A2P2LCE1_RHIMU
MCSLVTPCYSIPLPCTHTHTNVTSHEGHAQAHQYE